MSISKDIDTMKNEFYIFYIFFSNKILLIPNHCMRRTKTDKSKTNYVFCILCYFNMHPITFQKVAFYHVKY